MDKLLGGGITTQHLYARNAHHLEAFAPTILVDYLLIYGLRLGLQEHTVLNSIIFKIIK